MQTQQRSWSVFQQYIVVSFVASILLIAMYALCCAERFASDIERVHAQPFVACTRIDRMHIVVGGDRLASIATYYGFSEQEVAAYNHIVDPNSIIAGQRICIPERPDGRSALNSDVPASRALVGDAIPIALARSVTPLRVERRDIPVVQTGQASSNAASRASLHHAVAGYASRRLLVAVAGGFANAFPYGQCTWWAAQRYFQLHNVVVPWRSRANAGQWVDRAYENGWRVSSSATPGSIMVLFGGVEGASSVGHVGIVEQVLNDGTAIVSSMNWGYHGSEVSFNAFSPGRGVAFISQT